MGIENRGPQHGLYLETLSWTKAEEALAADSVVVIPLGASAKEHGPHLPLNTDALIAQWLAEQIRQRLPVVIAPLVNASYYPAFSEYPGSISLDAETACDMLVQISRSLASCGPQKFYVANTGVSTEQPLSMTKSILQSEKIHMEYLRLSEAFSQLDKATFEQQYGSHADEHETSLMLHIAPQVVDMRKAVDDGAEGEGALSREHGEGVWSRSGVYGQATLATSGKGKVVADALVHCAVTEIEKLLER
jgi:creatinine amidohydrolase